MNRAVWLLGFGIVCVGAALFAAPRYVVARKTADQSTAYLRMLTQNGPLVLDGATQAIFAHADQVETFRLVNPNAESCDPSMPVSSWPPGMVIEGCQVMHIGPAQGPALAAALRAALTQMPGGTQAQTTTGPNDFGSDVIFRVWQRKSHADLYVSFNTGCGEIISEDAHHKTLMRTAGPMGGSRPALLALSRQAFPQDSYFKE